MMRSSTIELYAQQADGVERIERARNATTLQVSPLVSRDVARRLGSTLLVGRYQRRSDPIYWATAPDGRRYWMREGMYTVYLAVMARIKADRDLKVGQIAIAAGVSRGYASKVIRKLATFGFITILGVWRGRWGRVVAKMRQCFLPSSKQGGNIETQPSPAAWRARKLEERRRSRYEDPWGSWRRSVERTAKAGPDW